MNPIGVRYRTRSASCGLIALLILVGCSGGAPEGLAIEDGNQVIRHPIEAYSPYREVPAQHLTLNEVSSGGEAWPDVLSVSNAAPRTIGGDENTPFGDITHLVRFQDGFVVGDNDEARVHIFKSDASPLGSIGRSGEGPGEFRRITAVAQVGERQLAVADVMRRVELFEMTDSLEYRRRVTLDFSPTSICAMDGRIFAYSSPGADSLPPIRILDESWTELSRIGRSYSSPNPMINSAMGEVTLLCAPALDRLVVVPRAGIGDVYILNVDGSPLARLFWSDFQSLALVEDADGYSATIQPGGLNRFRSGAVVRDSLVLLQYEFVSEADFIAKEGATSLHSVLVDLVRGEVVGRSSEWPALLNLADGSVVERLGTDWPGLRVHHRAER